MMSILLFLQKFNSIKMVHTKEAMKIVNLMELSFQSPGRDHSNSVPTIFVFFFLKRALLLYKLWDSQTQIHHYLVALQLVYLR